MNTETQNPVAASQRPDGQLIVELWWVGVNTEHPSEKRIAGSDLLSRNYFNLALAERSLGLLKEQYPDAFIVECKVRLTQHSDDDVASYQRYQKQIESDARLAAEMGMIEVQS